MNGADPYDLATLTEKVSALVGERDEALEARDRYKREMNETTAENERLRTIADNLAAQLDTLLLDYSRVERERDEARAIARRLVRAFRSSNRGMNAQPMLDALAAFDALAATWAKDDG